MSTPLHPPPLKVITQRCERCQGRGHVHARVCLACKGKGYFVTDLSGPRIILARPKRNPMTATARQKLAALIRERKADARCIRCGKPADGDRCDDCARVHAERMREKRTTFLGSFWEKKD